VSELIKIGLTACFMYPDVERVVFGRKSLSYFENDMLVYLTRKGVMPILIPDLEGELFDQYLNEMDAFVFQGGVDLAPGTYGDEPIENGRWLGDAYRDAYELKIMDYAFKNKKPVFGICRGFQLINAYFGGKLYQDLTLETKTKVHHRDADLYDQISHETHLSEGGMLADLYKKGSIQTNTVHHQGIKTLGKDLIEEAKCAEDGIIEAFTYKDMSDNFVLAVQWHPEFSYNLNGKVEEGDSLYDFFLSAIIK
jgi:putative glutamine amidotransferase